MEHATKLYFLGVVSNLISGIATIVALNSLKEVTELGFLASFLLTFLGIVPAIFISNIVAIAILTFFYLLFRKSNYNDETLLLTLMLLSLGSSAAAVNDVCVTLGFAGLLIFPYIMLLSGAMILSFEIGKKWVKKATLK